MAHYLSSLFCPNPLNVFIFLCEIDEKMTAENHIFEFQVHHGHSDDLQYLPGFSKPQAQIGRVEWE